jgi:benzoate-CoA ligase
MVICAELFAKAVLGIGSADRCFSVAKLFFAYGLGNALYFPLAVGAASVLWPGAPTPANIYAVIERHRPTLLFSVPTGYGMLLAHPEERREGGGTACDLSSVRLAVSAGEALPPALYERFKRRFGVDIIDGIGSTEVLHMFISNRPGMIRPGSSGLVVPGYEARILDEEKRAVARGETGNLWVKGDSICACYWNQHEKTKATLEGDWIRTGDKYTQDEDGFYWYAGRTDDMLKVGGLWVSPIEVENALIGHPAVQECGVVGREDHDTLVKPMAFVVLRPGHDATAPLAVELQRFVRSTLAEYKRSAARSPARPDRTTAGSSSPRQESQTTAASRRSMRTAPRRSPARQSAASPDRTDPASRSPPSGARGRAPRDRGTAPCRAARRESCARTR